MGNNDVRLDVAKKCSYRLHLVSFFWPQGSSGADFMTAYKALYSRILTKAWSGFGKLLLDDPKNRILTQTIGRCGRFSIQLIARHLVLTLDEYYY